MFCIFLIRIGIMKKKNYLNKNKFILFPNQKLVLFIKRLKSLFLKLIFVTWNYRFHLSIKIVCFYYYFELMNSFSLKLKVSKFTNFTFLH